MIERDVLARRWVHSHEEDRGDEIVFRTGEFSFPPSRGRAVLDLRADGTYVGSLPGPTDVPVSGDGRWRLVDDQLVIEGPTDRSPVPGGEIVSVDDERLVLRR
jgi:hypothetical protein